MGFINHLITGGLLISYPFSITAPLREMVASSPCSGGRYFRVGGCRSVRREEMPSGSGELELLGSESMGKNPVVWRFFRAFHVLLTCFVRNRWYHKDVFHVFFHFCSYPRKWIQVVQLGDWALPGRIRWYAQRQKPPFFFGYSHLTLV